MSKKHLSRIRNGGRHRRGITLVEVTVVVLIIGIIASVAGLRYNSALNYQRALRTAQQIRADLEVARHTARSRSQNVSLVFNVEQNRYTVSGVANPDHSGDYTLSLSSENLKASLKTVNFGGDSTVIFNAFGMPDSGGSLSVSAGAFTQTVTLAAGSGAATVP